MKCVSAYSELSQSCGLKSHQTRAPLPVQRGAVVRMDSDISKLEKKVPCGYVDSDVLQLRNADC